MDIVCTQYNSACSLSVETCAKRYQKATFNPDDGSLDPCRKCDDGKKNFDIWKESFKGQDTDRKKFSDLPIKDKKPYKCRFCETPTAFADRVCLKCQIEGKKDKDEGRRMKDENCRGAVPAPRTSAPEQSFREKKEEIMGGAKVVSAKICVACGREYKPTSNVQKRCPGCAAEHKKERDKLFKENKIAGKPKPQASHERDPRQSKAAIVPQGNIGPKGGRVSEPEIYTITVDFARFPKLHERLINIANDEIRNPGDQLLFMLKNTFETMEERV
jgi:hypothetical protein